MKLGICWLLFLPLLCFGKSQETTSDIIGKAQALTLQKEREQASFLLVRTIESEKLKKNQKDLKKALDEISKIFYTEKGQNAYEVGRSLFVESPLEADKKFQEALETEVHNVEILLERSRVLLRLKRCEDAGVWIQKALELNPYSQDLLLTQGQVHLCQQKGELALSILNPLESNAVVEVSRAQAHFLNQNMEEADRHLDLTQKHDEKFPEVYYWKVQVLKKEKGVTRDLEQLYIKACREFDLKDYQKYRADPKTCLEYKVMEEEHKSLLELERKKEELE